MNSVHEPGSRTMSKNRLRNNTESIQIENRPSAPSAQPVASPLAHAVRACQAPTAPCRARLPPAARSARLLLPAPRACCRLPLGPLGRPTRPAARPSAMSRHNCLSCDTVNPVSCHCTSQYNFCIAIQTPCSQASCNTNFAIQSLPSLPLLAIQ